MLCLVCSHPLLFLSGSATAFTCTCICVGPALGDADMFAREREKYGDAHRRGMLRTRGVHKCAGAVAMAGARRKNLDFWLDRLFGWLPGVVIARQVRA